MQLLLVIGKTFPRKAIPQKIQGAILMKKILLTVVLGIAVGAAAQTTSQPAQGQPATPPAQAQAAAPPAAAPQPAPVIKDPAEYNAYVAAVQATDPNAKISRSEERRVGKEC